MTSDEPRACPEFDCVACGRHIGRTAGDVPDPAFCRACLWIPGWRRDAGLRAILDPDGAARPRDGAADTVLDPLEN